MTRTVDLYLCDETWMCTWEVPEWNPDILQIGQRLFVPWGEGYREARHYLDTSIGALPYRKRK